MNERNLLILSKCSRDQSIGHAGLKVMIWFCPRGSGRSVGRYTTASNSRERFTPIHRIAGLLEFSEKIGFPGASVVHVGVDHTGEIGRNLQIAFLKSTNASTAKLAGKPEHFADNILASAGSKIPAIWSTDVIWRQ